MRHKAGHHPHYAGHRAGGLHVGANAKRSGPQPGKTEFSPAEAAAMRAPDNDADDQDMPQAAPMAPAGPAPGGAPPPAGSTGMVGGGSPIPKGMDQDGGI